ncbi:MAG: glycosyltransferase family 2 protein [Saprospiraceae bacterium]|nr:glycosyltransferase family 2 protein [Saprospiraceae bacterium]
MTKGKEISKLEEKGISIIICCYNSEKRLSPTLEHLSNVIIPEEYQCELIIVDNNSKDKTSSTAKNLWSQFGNPFTIKILKELNQGLIYARQLGIKSSKFNFILFADDDNWLDRRYLVEAVGILEKHPKIGILGGWGEGVFEVEPPVYFYGYYPFKSLHNNLAISKPGDNIGFLDNPEEIIFGAGTFFRRQVFIDLSRCGFKSLLTGRKGNQVISGEDAELCFATKMLGYKLYRTDKLKFEHYIPEGRLSNEYLKKLFFGFGFTEPIQSIYTYLLKNRGELANISQSVLKIKLRIFLLALAVFMIKLSRFKKLEKVTLLLEMEKGKLKYLSENQNDYKKSVATITSFYEKASLSK